METNNAQDVAKAALYAALAKAQGDFSAIAKNREVEITMKSGGRYKFRYADLEACIAATRPALSANGLAVFQRVIEGMLVTTVAHQDGGTIESMSRLQEGFADIKQYGASITYLRRYAYCAILCISADDDLDENGEALQGETAAPAKATNKQRPTKPEQLPPYQDADIQKNEAVWRESFAAGKSDPDRLISMISARNTLTDAQCAAIRALAPQQEQAEAAQ